MADTDISPSKTWGNEDLTPTDLNAEFSNVYSNHLSKSTAQTISGAKTVTADMTFNDSVNLTLGTGGDADVYYDGTDLIIDPRIVGSGVARVLNEAEVRGDAAAAGILTLSTAETTVVDGDKLGQIDFQAPLEASGTDSILVAASIWAEADATFDASTNTTDLVFAAATSETAGAVMRMSKTALFPHTDDGMALGILNTNEWSDLRLASGATITFDNSNAVITHSAGVLNVSTGALQVGGAAVQTGTAAVTALNSATENELVTVGATTTELDAETALMYASGTGLKNAADDEGFYTGASDDLRIYHNAAGPENYADAAINGVPSLHVRHTGSTNPRVMRLTISATAPDDNTEYFLFCSDNASARAYIYSDGDLQNHDNSYGAISDERLKQDIVDASSQWDDIKNLQVRKYRFKEDVTKDPKCVAHIGLIAQEAEKVSPGLVTYNKDDDTYGLQYSILYMKCVKALQECMTRIEALEAA